MSVIDIGLKIINSIKNPIFRLTGKKKTVLVSSNKGKKASMQKNYQSEGWIV